MSAQGCACSSSWHSRCAKAKRSSCRCKCKGKCHGTAVQPHLDSFGKDIEGPFCLRPLEPETLPEQ